MNGIHLMNSCGNLIEYPSCSKKEGNLDETEREIHKIQQK